MMTWTPHLPDLLILKLQFLAAQIGCKVVDAYIAEVLSCFTIAGLPL